MVLDHVSAKAGDDKDFPNASGDYPTEDVFEDRLAMHLEHGFRNFVGEFLHARAFAGGQNDSFHLCHRNRNLVGAAPTRLRLRLRLRNRNEPTTIPSNYGPRRDFIRTDSSSSGTSRRREAERRKLAHRLFQPALGGGQKELGL